jgi:hypothetical protein
MLFNAETVYRFMLKRSLDITEGPLKRSLLSYS